MQDIEYVQQPKPEVQKPPEKTIDVRTPTPEEVIEDTKNLYKVMDWGTPPPAALKPAEKKADDAAPPASDKKPEPEPEPEPQPEPEKEVTVPTTAEIIARAARETAREVADVMRPPAPEKPEAPEPEPEELSPKDQADLDVIQYLERTDPKRYQGKSRQFLDYTKKHYEYAAKWAHDNPGKEFNNEDQEHEDWYAKNLPDIDTDAVDAARVRAEVERQHEEREKPKREAARKQQALEKAIPDIGAAINKEIYGLVEAVDPELAKLITANGEPNLTQEAIDKLREKDPIAEEVLNEVAATKIEPFVLELEKTAVQGLDYKLNPARNPVHRQIADFVGEKESELVNGPAASRELDGKQFLSSQEFADRANRIAKLRPGERERKMNELESSHWTLTIDMVKELWTDKCGKDAAKIIQKRNAAGEKKFGAAKKTSQEPPPEPTTRTAPPPIPAGMKLKPPTQSGQSEVTTTRIPGGQKEKSFADIATDVNFSR